MTYSSPSFSAVVVVSASADPESGSVRPMAVVISPRVTGSSQRSFCS
jgi:hypothetical protein